MAAPLAGEAAPHLPAAHVQPARAPGCRRPRRRSPVREGEGARVRAGVRAGPPASGHRPQSRSPVATAPSDRAAGSSAHRGSRRPDSRARHPGLCGRWGRGRFGPCGRFPTRTLTPRGGRPDSFTRRRTQRLRHPLPVTSGARSGEHAAVTPQDAVQMAGGRTERRRRPMEPNATRSREGAPRRRHACDRTGTEHQTRGPAGRGAPSGRVRLPRHVVRVSSS